MPDVKNVELHPGDRQVAQVGQRRDPGAEVVEQDRHARGGQLRELVPDPGAGRHERGLGELHDDPPGGEPVPRDLRQQRRRELPSPSWSAETLTDTHRVRSWIDATNSTTRVATSWPSATDMPVSWMSERNDAGSSSPRVGCSQRTRASYPTHAGVGQVDDRLVVDHQLVLRDRRAELAVQVGGRAHRHRRLVHLRCGCGPTPWPGHSAASAAASRPGAPPRWCPGRRARSRCSPPTLSRRRPTRTCSWRPAWIARRDLEHRPRAVEVLHDDHELVAAEPRHRPATRGRGRSTSATCTSTSSPAAWPYRSFISLKPSRSQASTATRSTTRLLEDRLQDLLQQRAVGQAGQRVVHRAVREHLGLQPRLVIRTWTTKWSGAPVGVAHRARRPAPDRTW